jgi:MYXO-CTERM domain-containing protein
LAVPVEEDDDDGFPWGLLGLLGLAGLIPRKRRDERDTTVNRTDNR